MRALLEYQACGLNRIAKALYAGHSAGFHSSAVHEQGVELDAAVGSEKAATSCIERRIVFENGDCGFNGIKS